MKPEEEKGNLWLHCSFSDKAQQVESGFSVRALGRSRMGPSSSPGPGPGGSHPWGLPASSLGSCPVLLAFVAHGAPSAQSAWLFCALEATYRRGN